MAVSARTPSPGTACARINDLADTVPEPPKQIMARDQGSFSVVLQESDDRRTIPVSGAWGGPSPDGTTIVVHLYVEYPPAPSIMTGPVEAGGRVDLTKAETVRRADVIREVLDTLVMTPSAARNVGQWLLEKADLIERGPQGEGQ